MKKIQDSLVEEAKKKEEVARAMGDVDYEFTEAEFDSALKKMIFIAHQFDRRQLGPAGLAAFDADALTPSEFKEMLRRTFGVKLSPGELGALVTYFDTTMKGMVNCSAFINAYKQIRVQCEDFKVSVDVVVFIIVSAAVIIIIIFIILVVVAAAVFYSEMFHWIYVLFRCLWLLFSQCCRENQMNKIVFYRIRMN